jgi:hypothetical protein
MDATTRWETEAIRSSAQKRSTPPRPTAKRTRAKRPEGTWLTLKEAEAATGIPTNTLRKWVRKDAIDSYLESDGELAMRMLRLESVLRRAEELGRTIEPQPADGAASVDEPSHTTTAAGPATLPPAVEAPPEPNDPKPKAPASVDPPEGTMLVPIDAWNKMLNQLGNLHEAGQMLADARERAAKAETEATFLRERLAEIRADDQAESTESTDRPQPTVDREVEAPPNEAPAVAVLQDADLSTTTYWRYLTTGWRDRKKRSR